MQIPTKPAGPTALFGAVGSCTPPIPEITGAGAVPSPQSKRICFVLAICLAAPPATAGSQTVGGEGRIVSNGMLVPSCLKVVGHAVTEICANYTIGWKMWALMGEPVEDYTLSWRLTTISIAKSDKKGVVNFGPQNLPADLKTAVSEIEMYVDGFVEDGHQRLQHRMNTGVAVKAGARSSYNVPGSPNWSEFFVNSRWAPCDTPPAYVPEARVKDAFKKGIVLAGNIVLCKESGFSELEDVDIAIDKICKADTAASKFAFCSKVTKAEEPAAKDVIDDAFAKLESGSTAKSSSASNDALSKLDAKKPRTARGGTIDDAFAKLEVDKAAAARESERQHQIALAAQAEHDRRVAGIKNACTVGIGRQATCAAAGASACGTEPGPDRTVCTPGKRPDDAEPGRSHLLLPSCSIQKTPGRTEWERCVASAKSSCAIGGFDFPTVDACVASRTKDMESEPPPRCDKPADCPKHQYTNPGGIRG
jgi:hypothetical protein